MAMPKRPHRQIGKRKREDETSQQDKKSETHSSKKIRGQSQTSYDEQFATASPDQLKHILEDSIKAVRGDLSAIELEDLSLPASSFVDTTAFDQPRIVANLSHFLEQVVPGGEDSLKEPADQEGCPHTLLLTGAAIRAQALLAEVRKYGTESNKIAKLYAKHMKLNDHIAYVEKTKFGIGAGSPHRISGLIDRDVLKVTNLKHIVVDGSFLDSKQRTIFNDKEAFAFTLSLLNQEALKLRLASSKTKMIVF